MPDTPPNKLRERVLRAAEDSLRHSQEVGPLEVLQRMGLLSPAHVEGWQKGNEYYPTLERWIQGSPDKLEKTYRYFSEWVRDRGLRPVQVEYHQRGPRSSRPLQITETGDPERETFFRTHYLPADLPAHKAKAVEKKLQKAPDLVVFILVADQATCSECGAELTRGQFLCMEKDQPLCLSCADMDHLVFLPSGDATLSRRARTRSKLSAVVVRFNRPRKRYERQGILVTSEALAAAEDACAADADKRAVGREKAAVRRELEDEDFVAELSAAILDRFPRCPSEEARRIATHTGLRGSGRVGRSAAGRDLQAKAIDLAVAAHIRHEHTNYDELLMSGVERATARHQIREKIETMLDRWR